MDYKDLHEQVEIRHEDAGTGSASRAALIDGLAAQGWLEIVRDEAGNETAAINHNPNPEEVLTGEIGETDVAESGDTPAATGDGGEAVQPPEAQGSTNPSKPPSSGKTKE